MTTETAATVATTESLEGLTYETVGLYLNKRAAEAAATKQPHELAVGDIVYMNSGYSMVLPTFGIVTKRTPCTYVIEELPTVHFGMDQYNQQGMELPVLDRGTVSRGGRRTRSNRFSKSGNIQWNGRYATYWDGKAHWFDTMD